MTGRLGIDFGASNTVVAVWNESTREGVPLHIPDFGKLYVPSGPVATGDAASAAGISVIPSLIHYSADGKRWIGAQVIEKGFAGSAETFALMKRYIANRSPVSRRLRGRSISHFEAGRDFLSAVLLFACQEGGGSGEEVALTVPVEAFEHYSEWLSRVAEGAGLPRFRLIDEPSAAALGYGVHVQPGHVYLVFDFGGGTLDVSIVLIEEEDASGSGRRCRVLGKAGRELGGSSIDGWILQHVLEKNGRSDADEEIRPVSGMLLEMCRAAKETLSSEVKAEVKLSIPGEKTGLQAELTRAGFEDLLDRHEAFVQIDQTIRRALNGARDRGYSEEHIAAVLMVGGGSLIPCIQKTVGRIFGKDLVRMDRPIDAVARGAAALMGGVDFYDHIQHDYAIRWVNPALGDYDFKVIVSRGTPYPSAEAVARLTVKGSYPGQTELGLAIFELGGRTGNASNQAMELVFDPAGAARLVQVPSHEQERRHRFWINEESPTFLKADPPTEQGSPCFAVEFGIDANKHLVITARDLRTGRVTHRDFPLVKLT
ncbi:MAG: Hsp70 family protein [Verrucomicrobia bacterium]|nr:Hsp70 family protein [Verrucomicrobiota bacterium]